ncbi:MAG: 4Fe-4S binding protein [Candidatus Woesearchaeota archaeon]
MRIGITGGKGGTGKSTMATALARQGTQLVDMDVDCPNDHLILSLSLEKIQDVKQRIPRITDGCYGCSSCIQVCMENALIQIPGQKPECIESQCNGCGACYYRCPKNAIEWEEKIIGSIKKGEGLLSGELNIGEPNAERVVSAIKDIIDQIDNDQIIIDTAAGTHCNVIAALELCDKVFCVAEPTPLGSHDLDLMLTLCASLKKPTQIIINKSDIGDTSLIETLASRHKVDIVARVPYDESILKNYAAGTSIEIKELEGLV